MRAAATALTARCRADRVANILSAGLAWLPPAVAGLFILALVVGKMA